MSGKQHENWRQHRLPYLHAVLRCFKPARLLVAGLLCLFLSVTAFAQGLPELDADVSLTLQYKKDGKPIEGAVFRLYRAAAVSEDLQFTPEGAFASYPVSWMPEDSGAWKALAETLSGYVKRDKLQPLMEGKTDAQGQLKFERDTLRTGLYLVLGEQRVIGRYTYTPEPFLVCLPSYGENNTWDYTPVVLPKSSSSYDPPGGGGGEEPGSSTTTRKVLKRWEQDIEANRPSEITVQLLKNGKVYDTVKLTAANGWSYTWSGLDKFANWEIVEAEVPGGYTVSVSQEGITFVLTNKGTDGPPGEPGKPGKPGEPNQPGEPGESATPSIPGSAGGNPYSAGGKREGKLPQTGLLWYPVPLLAFGGLLCFGIGWYLTQRKHEDDDHA